MARPKLDVSVQIIPDRTAFFVVTLNSRHVTVALPPVNDPDPIVHRDLMDDKENFLLTAYDRHWEFSNLRRAKFSTLALCYELHNQGRDRFLYICNNCSNTNALWHCPTCDDFDLCQTCFVNANHGHLMEAIRGSISNEATSDQNSVPTENTTNRSGAQTPKGQIQWPKANCGPLHKFPNANHGQLSRHRTKRCLQDKISCKAARTTSCPACKELIQYWCHYIKHCTAQNSSAQYRRNIWQTLVQDYVKQSGVVATDVQRLTSQMKHRHRSGWIARCSGNFLI
ncbi:unnamed protein product [Soboliphyme baturini]|uniref:histone acetyltransferase n=1 Tax=Soboliphyme baturini TaxID=241478 RepID=A0A183IZC5_9BILA|nr:unnamed protein product [Soboliphyme baturini]